MFHVEHAYDAGWSKYLRGANPGERASVRSANVAESVRPFAEADSKAQRTAPSAATRRSPHGRGMGGFQDTVAASSPNSAAPIRRPMRRAFRSAADTTSSARTARETNQSQCPLRRSPRWASTVMFGDERVASRRK